VRLHQSWYRDAVLRVPYGETSGSKPRHLGSVLPRGIAQAGLNFVSDAAHRLYRTRRGEGWGLAPDQCERHMTSSQAMTVNLFAPLFGDRPWFTRVLEQLIGRRVSVYSAYSEWGPRDRYARLNERTLADVVVHSSPEEIAVVFEVKYADRFTSRLFDLDRSPAHARINHEQSLWSLGREDELRPRGVNQLARVHALAAAYSTKLPVLILLCHEADSISKAVGSRYAELVARPGRARRVTISAFLSAMARSAESDTQVLATSNLHLRYAAEEQSAHLLPPPSGTAVRPHTL
jgi:hypothetical protein